MVITGSLSLLPKTLELVLLKAIEAGEIESVSVGHGKKKRPMKRGPACLCLTHPDLRQTMPSP